LVISYKLLVIDSAQQPGSKSSHGDNLSVLSFKHAWLVPIVKFYIKQITHYTLYNIF